jgi:hypothetical protein
VSVLKSLTFLPEAPPPPAPGNLAAAPPAEPIPNPPIRAASASNPPDAAAADEILAVAADTADIAPTPRRPPIAIGGRLLDTLARAVASDANVSHSPASAGESIADDRLPLARRSRRFALWDPR